MASQVVLGIVGIVLLSFLAPRLGDRLYGAWFLIASIVGYYGLLDLGLSSAVARFVSRELGRENKDEADRYVAAAFYVFCAGGAVLLLVAGLTAALCGLFMEAAAETATFPYAVLIAGSALALAFPARCYYGVLRAHLRFDLLGFMDIGCAVLRAGLIVGAVLLGGRLVAMALAGSAIALLRIVLVFTLARRVHGRISLSPSRVTRARVKTLFRYSVVSFAAQATELGRRNVYPLIIWAVMGMAMVTPFAVAAKIMDLIMRMCISLLSIMMPVFSRQEGRNDDAAIRWSYLFTYKIACYVGVFLAGMLAVCGAAFVERMMTQPRPDIVTLLYIGLVGVLFVVIQLPTMNLLYGISRHRYYAICNAIDVVVAVVLSSILIHRFGLVGVVVAAASVSAVVRTFLLARGACKVLGLSLAAYHVRHTLPNLLRAAPFVAAAYLLAGNVLAPSYIRLALVGLGATLLYVPYILFVGFNKSQRAVLLRSVGLARAK